MSSGLPKICSAVLFSTWFTSLVQSTSLAPSTGSARYARASARPARPKCCAVELRPSPRSCGKMNHIQCVRLLPPASSRRTVSITGAWASTKRCRSNSFIPNQSPSQRCGCVPTRRRR